jgi:hypothetical protein
MVETHRDEARLALDASCILGDIEIELLDAQAMGTFSTAGAEFGAMSQL